MPGNDEELRETKSEQVDSAAGARKQSGIQTRQTSPLSLNSECDYYDLETEHYINQQVEEILVGDEQKSRGQQRSSSPPYGNFIGFGESNSIFKPRSRIDSEPSSLRNDSEQKILGEQGSRFNF